jgi:thiamine biosynthesis protein ThiS
VRVVVNGTPRDLSDGLTIRQLIALLGLDRGPVAVERNNEVVPRVRHEDTLLLEGDIIEIVHFVGGG